MIFQSFLLGNLVSLCMKIINSVVVVGLYYGFLTTFSIGPSYLFLLRAQVMEEGTEKKVSATTGFITGQLMMFISIYYAPLHLALGRPHTITVLALPYLLFHFFWNNHKHFGSTTRNSMRNLSIQCVFLNNLIFQLFNHFILPSSMLARLVNIYMFRCNNKMLFVTSSFLGWLIGHILFMKWLGLVLVWIQQSRSIRSNKYKHLVFEYKYLVSQFLNSMPRIFSILLFITCVYYLGRMPSPILTKKLKGTAKTEERVESEKERDVEIETAEDPASSLFSEEIRVNGKEKKKDEFFPETGYNNSPVSEDPYMLNMNGNKEKWWEPLVTLLFDYNRWNRPFRYIKNNRFEGVVRNEMSQYFFDICLSDGKQRISFTYPPSLSTSLDMIDTKILLSKLSSDEFLEIREDIEERLPSTPEEPPLYELDNHWVYTNKEKNNNLNKEFLNRIKVLDREPLSLNIIETRTRLCNDDTKKEYFPKMYDPFLNGPYRGTIKRWFSPSILTFIENCKKSVGVNRIHSILRPYTDYQRIMNAMAVMEFRMGIKNISKEVPRRSYKLITELEQMSEEYRTEWRVDHEIRSRKCKRVVVFALSRNLEGPEEVSLIHYSQLPDFRRGLIKGSMRAQRRKIVIWNPFQGNTDSLIFWGRIPKFLFFSFDISPLINFDTPQLIKLIFRNWGNWVKEVKVKIETYIKKKIKRKGREKKGKSRGEKKGEKKRRAEARINIAEAWASAPVGQQGRSLLLITQSIFRKYIRFPVLIIAKNIGRLLLFQPTEWSEDLEEWNKEKHIKCTYNGVELSEREFPKKWLTEGIQIKILFPFRLKPWHSDKDLMEEKKQKNDFCFLTVWGKEAERPFGSPREEPPFFEPIIRELAKIDPLEFFLKMSKKRDTWVTKSIIFIINFLKVNKNPSLKLREVYESNETQKEKDSIISNQIIHESFSQIQSPGRTNSLPTEKKTKNLTDKISIIKYQIKRITKEKKKATPAINIWQILKRRNARFTYKLHYFLKFERIYIDIFLYITNINISRINTQLVLESTKKIIEKFIYNNKSHQKKINKQNKSEIRFISTIKKSFDNISKKKSHIFTDLPNNLSQAYVFYKLSQTQVRNLYKLRSVLQYQGTSFFLKTEIKDSFGTLGIFQPELRQKKLKNYGMNEWKNWLRLRGWYYQYDLSNIRWSRLIPQKWRNRINQCRMTQNKNLNKKGSDEKDPLIHYKKGAGFQPKVWKEMQKEIVLLQKYLQYQQQNPKRIKSLNQKDTFPKYYRYDLLSYKFLNYENKRNSSIYGSRFEINNNPRIPYNSNTHKDNILENIASNYNIGRDDLIYIKRKYLDWKIINFDLSQTMDIGVWSKIATKRNPSIQNYKIFDKSEKKDLFYLTIHQDLKINSTNPQKVFFDWMGMNEEIISYPISNPQLWFFPEFVQLYYAYKRKPWVIPSKLLLLNWNRKENIGANQNINGKDFVIPHQEEPADQEDLGSVLANQQKDIEEDYAELGMQKDKKKEQYQNDGEIELYIFLKRYLLFQLRWTISLNQRMINHIKLFAFLLRLKNTRKITLSTIQRQEINPDILHNPKSFTPTELVKKGVLIVEPLRLSVKNDGQFIMYQTIGIPLVHKSKHEKTNQRYVDKTYFNLLVPENIFSSRRCRELRILICFNSKNRNSVDRNTIFYKREGVKNCNQFLDESKHPGRDKNQNQNELIKLKFFLWPNYRLEDLACMNRYWFDTNNGSCFSMLRIHMYPRLKIRY
uniref:Ycf1 protein n=1 Tax=Cordia monoica TaxID=222084 RepID=UPI002A8153E3|nr:Ycf1 protein [Cordia monoica]WOH22085.1 Ycf1 protein [Cordia monoica]